MEASDRSFPFKKSRKKGGKEYVVFSKISFLFIFCGNVAIRLPLPFSSFSSKNSLTSKWGGRIFFFSKHGQIRQNRKNLVRSEFERT